MRAPDRMIVAVTLAAGLAALTLTPLTEDRGFLGLGWLLLLLLGVVTFALRRLRLGAGAVLAVQAAVLVAFVLALAASGPGRGEEWFRHYPAQWVSGIEHMQTQAAPMAPNPGVTVIFVTVVGGIMVLTDLLVSGLRRPMWGLAPPAALFLVPAIGLGADTGVFNFLCVAVGYLGILVAEGLNQTARWTRGLSSDSADRAGTATPVVWRAAGLIGAPALALTVALGLALPTLTIPGLGFGDGPGSGGPLQLTDPTLDLRRNLNQPTDAVVMQYQTEKPGGLYLRMASLPELNATGWHNVAMQLSDGATLPPVPGLSGEPSERRSTSIRVFDFRSEYLPLPYAPRAFEAEGNWASDANSLVVISGSGRGRDDAIRNLAYRVQSIDVEPDEADLQTALAGTPVDASVTAAQPPGLPQDLIDLTNRITEDADTPLLKAAAIQRYLRSSRFTYSTEPLPGSGYRALENFLLRDRRGYCEQFAGAMAMMARVAGIPSRVAVGFLPGRRQGETWRVSIRDMHAWPELFFAGYGWVRFEPTPASVTGTAPSWTVPDTSRPTDTPSSEASSQPSSQASGAAPSESVAPSAAPAPAGTGAGAGWLRTLVIAGIGLVLLLVLAAPATLRIRRRSERLSGDGEPAEQVESAWQEIRDTVLDYGGTWPEGSPRAIGRQVGDRLDPPESSTMTEVATLVERSRYARSVDLDDASADLATITHGIRRGLAAPRSAFRRALAFVVPRSLFRRGR